MKPLKDRTFFKVLKACDAISDCMDENTGIIKDLKLLEKELKIIFDNQVQ
ncbi:MAG: hypothetical protein ACXAAI_05375 [Promethearchaeota archaeon]